MEYAVFTLATKTLHNQSAAYSTTASPDMVYVGKGI